MELNDYYSKSNSNINSIYNEINDLNEKILTSNINLNKLYKDFENESTLKINVLLKNFSEKSKENLINFITTLEETTKIINDEVNSVKNTTKNFNQFISDETSIKLTNNFKDKSEIEKKWYYSFNFISGIIIGIAIWISYSSLTDFSEKHATNFSQLDLYYLAIRLLFSFLIFSTIAFTNKLANKHYFHWKKNESIYLKLTALKSFIADMSPEKQQDIHEKLIDVYFGKEDLDPTIYKKFDNSSESLLKMIADKLPSIGDQKKSSN